MKIEKEDFESWRDHPVTEQVFAALRSLADEAKETWMKRSWGGGKADPLELADLRARAEIIGDLLELTYEELDAKLERDLSD